MSNVNPTMKAIEADGGQSGQAPKADRDRLDRVLMMLLIAGSIAAGAVAMHALDAMTGR
jgi:hypothetical protein